jgi:hypothetical protein
VRLCDPSKALNWKKAMRTLGGFGKRAQLTVGGLFAVSFLAIPALGQTMSPLQQSRLAQLEVKRLHEFSNVELAEYLPLRSLRFGAQDQKQSMRLVAEKALQQPYRFNATRFDLAEADCVVFCERAIALSLSHDWQTYYRLLQRISHKDGVVSALERNSFPLADWIPNNAWLLTDITAQVGPTQEFTYSINRRKFYEDMHFGETQDNPVALAKRTAKATKVAAAVENEAHVDRYIPKDRLSEVAASLQTGDICFLIREPSPAQRQVHCDHMGMIVKEDNGELSLLHSAPPRARKDNLVGFLSLYKWNLGIKVVRLRDNAGEVLTTELARVPADSSTPADMDAKSQAVRNLRLNNH